METVTLEFTNDDARYLMYTLRKRYGKDGRTTMRGLCDLAVRTEGATQARENLVKAKRETEEFELFLAAQDHAKIQLEEAKPEDKQYWQGVKDGLRKCYAIFTNDPCWETLSGGSPQGRPTEARRFLFERAYEDEAEREIEL